MPILMLPFSQDASRWNELIAGLPNPHLLQTWEWAQVKARYGWEPRPVYWSDKSDKSAKSEVVAAAMILKRRIPVGGFAARLNILYIPKGPLLDWSNEALRERVLDDLQAFAKRQGAIFLKIDPDVRLGTGLPGGQDESHDNGGPAVMSALKRRGWRFSAEQIQFRNTVLLDLSVSEEEMLARMKQKTRYNVRLAGKKGVRVRSGSLDDLPMLYKMYAETSLRDNFVIRDEAYYQAVWQTFMQPSTSNAQPGLEPFIAEVDDQPVAALMLFRFAGRAYYLYGMSRDVHREKMPAYLLQWEAMRRAKAAGCSVYDLWGAPDVFDASDRMWGVFRFKEGLGGQVVRTLGAWDYTPSPLLYQLYSEILPRVLDVMRIRGKARTRQAIG
ncbi:MAG: peptidoglycan bridge formation glycyltransferase FemA/FemB family protein [Anaerolineales bacterium]